MADYQLIVIGAGPGGIFSAYELMQRKPEWKVAVLEARRHYCWYLKGVKYANYYKDQINHMETLEDLYRITAGIKRDLSD